MSFYVATLLTLAWLRLPNPQVIALTAVCVATLLTVMIWERGRWSLGLFVPPQLALRELAFGLAAGAAVIGACAALIVATTSLRHAPGRGFPWLELFTVFIPAALHEELVFRGYVFQKLWRWRRGFALLFVAFIFAALHMNNTAVTMLGIGNVFLGGVLLGVAYERYERLWFPIGLHLAWNLMSGPILGHEVSGYVSDATLFVTRGEGAAWLTGGDFGIEGSVWMTFVEIVAIAALVRRNASLRARAMRNSA
ncbi:MAG TPA: CPBP family intramembrane glutamic endopeptidase [Thermoanaerobaculia bacterium]|nr:CPBP family intramembrane glutamic endopeptidase [Thermoanaerobaculia bacterium]